MWLRYVDATFVIWPNGEEALNDFLRHLSSRENSIKFSVEKESEIKIPFRDDLAYKNFDGALKTIFTFESNHQNNVKVSQVLVL